MMDTPRDPAAATPTPSVPEALHREVLVARDQARKNVFLLSHQGRQVVVKFPDQKGRGWLHAWLMRTTAAPMVRHPLPVAPFRLKPPAERTAFEAQRLHALAEAGAPVPRLVGLGDGYLIMEHAGQRLENWTRDLNLPPAEVDARVLAAARALAQLHCTGGWHGAPQLRNIMVRDDGSVAFIDFEEDLSILEPEARHAYDLLQFLSSLVVPRDDGPHRPELTERAARAYLALMGDGPLGPLAAYQRRAARIKRWLGPVRRRLGKDVQRTFGAIDVVEALLRDPAR
ncbi:lipopolysaccharide kinase InaA family protein [Halorhodospira halophila]